MVTAGLCMRTHWKVPLQICGYASNLDFSLESLQQCDHVGVAHFVREAITRVSRVSDSGIF